MKFKPLVCLLLPFSLALTANAESQPADTSAKSLISLGVEVTKEVDYDVMEVSLFVQQENKNLKELNQVINTKVNAALALIKQQSAVQIKRNSRHTYVNYNAKGKQSGWVERAELVLESKDFMALSQVISELNETFAIVDVVPKLSHDAAATFEDEMIKNALTRFQHKAQVVQSAMNAKGYRIVNLRLTDDNGDRRFAMQPVGKMMAYAESTADNVNLESQEKVELKASINGEIELLN